ncbi:unnamed protein product [Calicophoron daubneyi]|uniref:Insulin-induced gene 1 protein n=1 Tax=Calicophoron daubneyi TaxID=300641 RepID=A0AAV2T972_CALDB
MAGRLGVCVRGSFLFILGVAFFYVSDIIQGIRFSIVDPYVPTRDCLNPKIWIPLGCGAASVAVGLLSPLIDSKLGHIDVYDKEWPSVLRCIALFLGFNHATARIDFASYLQLAFIVFGLSVGLWWIFDGSGVGLGFGLSVALVATILGYSLPWRNMLRLSNPMMSAWIPCLFFSGAVITVLVGRQLAKPDVLTHTKQKMD